MSRDSGHIIQTSKFKPLDGLIEYLKSANPFAKERGFNLWQVLKNISDELVSLSLTINPLLTIETPKGTIDGVNKVFTLSQIPANTFIMGFKNGLLLLKGNTYVANDFLMQDNRITFTAAPAMASVLQFIYYIQGS